MEAANKTPGREIATLNAHCSMLVIVYGAWEEVGGLWEYQDQIQKQRPDDTEGQLSVGRYEVEVRTSSELQRLWMDCERRNLWCEIGFRFSVKSPLTGEEIEGLIESDRPTLPQTHPDRGPMVRLAFIKEN